MRLTGFTDYAFRTLLYLGARPDRLCTIEEVATAYGISKNHLMKVASRLVRLDLIESVRGRNGGLRLKAEAKRLRLGDVVREFEDNFALVACFPGGSGLCAISPACRLKSALNEALEAFLGTLDRYTLADMLDNRKALAELLGAPARAQAPA
jgi:Rrf2 family nitric oxide-sensitive transcriptional repressor